MSDQKLCDAEIGFKAGGGENAFSCDCGAVSGLARLSLAVTGLVTQERILACNNEARGHGGRLYPSPSSDMAGSRVLRRGHLLSDPN